MRKVNASQPGLSRWRIVVKVDRNQIEHDKWYKIETIYNMHTNKTAHGAMWNVKKDIVVFLFLLLLLLFEKNIYYYYLV